jgi:hypothetical protein
VSTNHHVVLEVCPSALLEAEAAAEASVTVRASCSAGCDLGTRKIRIVGADGVVGEVELGPARDGVSKTTGLRFPVPVAVGTYDWRVIFIGDGQDSARHHAECSSPLNVSVKPHRTSLAVWDLSSPQVINQPSNLKVGVKCSAGCRLAGQEVEILSGAGTEMSRAKLGTVPWPGTEALHWAEVTLPAPEVEGIHDWAARFTPAELALPHLDASYDLRFVAARGPEHRVTVQVIAEGTDAAVPDVVVRAGPYRASTDEAGVAELAVAGGHYKLGAWKEGYENLRKPLEINGDVTIRLALATAVEPEEEYWM